jgi:nucleoside-diphosphate-sugar epimerase
MRGTVAITGATGFLGAALVKAVSDDGWRVRILARRMPQAALQPAHQIEVTLGDLDDAASLRRLCAGADTIVHCAGVVKALNPADFMTVNAGGTERVLQAAASAAPSARLVHISSLAAREPQLSPYAASKAAAETKVQALAGNRDWICLRPPAIYGPGDLEILPLFKAAKLGFVTYPAAPEARVSLLHVADVAAAVAALLAGPAWNGRLAEIDDGAGGGHDWPGIIAALGQALGKPPTALRLPRPLFLPIAAGATLLARLTGQPMVLSLGKVPELYHPDWVAQGPGLPEGVHWQPRFALAAGFADTLAWYRREALL